MSSQTFRSLVLGWCLLEPWRSSKERRGVPAGGLHTQRLLMLSHHPEAPVPGLRAAEKACEGRLRLSGVNPVSFLSRAFLLSPSHRHPLFCSNCRPLWFIHSTLSLIAVLCLGCLVMSKYCHSKIDPHVAGYWGW